MEWGLLSRAWFTKNRTPNQDPEEHQREGAGVRAKAAKRKKTAKNVLQCRKEMKLLHGEMLKPPDKRKRKKPWSRWLKDFAKWLIILKLLAALIKEVYKIIS